MAILVAKALHHISSERNEKILHLFQMLIIHQPGISLFLKIHNHLNKFSFSFHLALLDLRVSFAHYIQSFDQSLLPKNITL